MSSRKSLYLFAQLPLDCTFAFESPDNPIQFTKTHETQAVQVQPTVGLPQVISPNVLVFPVYPFCLLTPVDIAEQEARLVGTEWEECI